MRREYNIPKGVIRVSSITFDRAVIAVPYDMRNGFAVEMKFSIPVEDKNWINLLKDANNTENLDYYKPEECLEIICRPAYVQYRDIIYPDNRAHVVKASNQYNYNGENYRLNFDGSDKTFSWRSQGTSGVYWEDSMTAYIGELGTIYYCKLYDRWGTNGLENVVNDLVPVGNTETGEGGLLDLLTGELYWNINEGGRITFTL